MTYDNHPSHPFIHWRRPKMIVWSPVLHSSLDDFVISCNIVLVNQCPNIHPCVLISNSDFVRRKLIRNHLSDLKFKFRRKEGRGNLLVTQCLIEDTPVLPRKASVPGNYPGELDHMIMVLILMDFDVHGDYPGELVVHHCTIFLCYLHGEM